MTAAPRFGGAGPDRGSGVAVLPEGDVFLTETYSAGLDLGQGPLSAGPGPHVEGLVARVKLP